MASKRPPRDRGPDEYISNNMTVRAWRELAQIQAEARKAGITPSKSAVLIALCAIAETRMHELLDRLRETA